MSYDFFCSRDFVREQVWLAFSITSSSICVASRCPWVRAGVGAASTQNITDPSLGNEMLDLIAKGSSPEQAIQMVTKGRKFIDYRQLAVIDIKGRSASFTGSETLGTNAVLGVMVVLQREIC